jgi:hypothetical protein
MAALGTSPASFPLIGDRALRNAEGAQLPKKGCSGRRMQLPHLFRTRNNLIDKQPTRSISNEIAEKSTILVEMPSLIPVLFVGSSPAGPSLNILA